MSNTPFHYKVKANLVKITNSDDVEFYSIEEEFRGENPILAREKAFNYYQNNIDVLLEKLGKTYTNHQNASEDLSVYLSPQSTLSSNATLDSFLDTFFNGIGVFLVIETPISGEQDSSLAEVQDEFLLHGIGSLGRFNDPQSLMDSLTTEMEYYQHFEFDIKDFGCTVYFYEYDIAEKEPNFILKTPFDWTGYDKPFPGGFSSAKLISNFLPPTNTIEEIIKNGEGEQVEFKSSLVYNFSKGSGGIGIKGIIAKSITAFLNSKGGLLIIGVRDDGRIQGLEPDFQISTKANPKDYFLLEFDDMLKQFGLMPYKTLINSEFYSIDEKFIYLVFVQPNPIKPVFFKGLNGKEFWIRANASTRQLTDPEELATYSITHWGNHNKSES